MIHLPSRPHLVALALLWAGAICGSVGLAGVALGIYVNVTAGWWLVSLAGLGGFLVFASVVSDGIQAEHRRIDADENARQEAAALANEQRRLELDRAQQPEVDQPEPELDTAELPRLERQREFEIAHWQVYFRRLVAAACAYGWDIRTLTDPKRATRVTTQPGWNLATDALREAGYLHKDNTGSRLLVSEADWNAERLWERVPCPAGEPPEIVPPPYARQQTPHETTGKHGAGVVVDMEKG